MLLGSVGRLHKARIDQSVEQLGLNRSQAMLLLWLARGDGRTHSEIAEHLDLSPAAATKIIKYMEQEGYVQRQGDADDERVSRVFLLDRGRAVTAMIYRAFLKLDEQLFEGVSAEDLARLREVLAKMYANLQGAKV